MTSWIEELKENCQKETVIVIVGNKRDMDKSRQVSYQEGLNFAKKYGFQFTETCAFEKETVEPLFGGIADTIMEKIASGEIDPTNERVGVKVGSRQADSMKISKKKNAGGTEKKKGCC